MMSRVGVRSLIKPLRISSRAIQTIPQPPGYIVGTVNDAYVPPAPHKTHGSYHWVTEKIIAVGMVPLTITPFVTGVSTPVLDSLLAGSLLIHCYAGFQSCIIDYIPLRVYGKFHHYAMYLLGLGTALAGYGIYQIEKKEKEGLVGIIKRLWKA
ncbi:BA75_02169T0 [Komagataella pastoris]|uniref:Succinate dehydrogenase [ubiquinone] cytochrome b small subunit n=1 Tax=Komagataella pastoris TaxID=4922 RepID=A0A1B2JAV8_PICPA|nr:BA75_02169T0 [Komagataella pastoris]